VRPTPPPSDPGQGVNVKVDIAITDQAAAGESSTKTISFLAADRSAGSIRSTANTENARVNVDATPQILPNGNIRIQLGLEYNPRQARAAAQASKSPSGEMVMIPPMAGGSSLNQRVTVVLEPGKPLILSQAADPLSDRKISVEIRASVQK
jgi:hypothetical protein